jgi:hypothetical protein
MNPSRSERVLQEWDTVTQHVPRPDIPPEPRASGGWVGFTVATIVGVAVIFVLGVLTRPAVPSVGTRASETPQDTWGPLAVAPASDSFGEALASGTLQLTDTCAFLEQRNGEHLVLVWPSDRTTWDPIERSVTLTNSDGTAMTMRDDEQVTLGGAGGGSAEGGLSGEEWIRQNEWVEPPASSCLTDAWWEVGEAVPRS